MAEQAWRPRFCVRAQESGSPWVPVRSYYEGLPSMAGRGPDEGPAKASLDQRGVTLPCPDPEDGPGVEDATSGAPEGGVPARHAAPQGADLRRCAFRRSAPSRVWGKGNDGGPTPDKEWGR